MILGLGTSLGNAAPLLTVETNTTQVGAEWAPVNCVAIWVENEAGEFIKTIGRWCQLRNQHLVAWQAKAGLNDVDAVSGASRPDHSMRLSVTWDVKDKLGVLVPDGIYRVRMETADGDSTTSNQNWQGSFTFTKGLAPDIQMPADPGAHYLNVSIKYDPTANECNNNVVDVGETCDPPGSCPVDCEPSGDACAPNVVVGTAATCTAACAIVEITSCINGDGCCVEGCGPLMDSDCTDEKIDGGCSTNSTGPSSALPLSLGVLGALVMFGRRRRR
ncbi:MAG: DUF2271 domain-containing protein [Kofleriaceae bacterium]|nr:DUF2271 domain-containing protein [Kofleriaceae bacterium]